MRSSWSVLAHFTTATSSDGSKVSGGTGITPFFQLVHSELAHDNRESRKTRFTLLHSSRTPGDLPPPLILDPLLSYSISRPDRFRMRLFVDDLAGSDRALSFGHDLQVGRIGRAAIEQSIGLSGETGFWRRILPSRSRETSSAASTLKDRKVLFLVCGPPA